VIQSHKKERKTDMQTALQINSPPYRKSVYAPQNNRTHEREASSNSESALGIIKFRVSTGVDREGELGSNGSDGITCLGVRKVTDLFFENNLMRANAVAFKNSSVGVVGFIQPELVPVLMVMNRAKGARPGAGASMTAAGTA
jgi:hypothetical protein